MKLVALLSSAEINYPHSMCELQSSLHQLYVVKSSTNFKIGRRKNDMVVMLDMVDMDMVDISKSQTFLVQYGVVILSFGDITYTVLYALRH